METRSSYSLIEIGLAIRLLQNIKGLDKKFILDHMERLEDRLERNGFAVSLVAFLATDLKQQIEKANAPISGLLTQLENHISKLEMTVFAEAVTKKVYVLEQRRYTTAFLLDSPDQLLSQGEFDRLSDLARSDFRGACKCLLFGQATATAFHILRATEEVLKSYYRLHRKQKRLAKPMWGSMVDQLRKKSRQKPPSALLSELDNIRESYRNPTQHPEAVYDLDGAQNLFGLCLSAISKMAGELPEPSGA